MNNLSLIGNITNDLELMTSQNGTNYLTFNIAVQRAFKDKQSGEYKSDFPRCKAFGKTAEIIAEHFGKGSKIGITGSIQTDRYDDKDGKTIFTTDVLVNQITFVERKGSSGGQSSQQNERSASGSRYGNESRGQNKSDSYTNAYSGQSQQRESNPFKDDGPVDISDDDLPF